MENNNQQLLVVGSDILVLVYCHDFLDLIGVNWLSLDCIEGFVGGHFRTIICIKLIPCFLLETRLPQFLDLADHI